MTVKEFLEKQRDGECPTTDQIDKAELAGMPTSAKLREFRGKYYVVFYKKLASAVKCFMKEEKFKTREDAERYLCLLGHLTAK